MLLIALCNWWSSVQSQWGIITLLIAQEHFSCWCITVQYRHKRWKLSPMYFTWPKVATKLQLIAISRLTALNHG